MKFITNLNGTILCPYQILLDLSEQIPNSPPRIKNLAFAPICDLNSTNDWINLESLGKPVAIRAKVICDAVCSLLKNTNKLSLDIYCQEGQLSSDNLYSLLYLAQACDSLELTFFTTNEAQNKLKEKIESLTSEKNVSIQFKTNKSIPETLTHLENARQKAIKSMGFTLDDDFLNSPQLSEAIINQLIGFSWLCLKSGGYDISCSLLEQTKNHPDISAKAQEQLFMHLLMMRFFSHQYALIAETEFPEHFSVLEQSEVRKLEFLTAYSATLSRNLNVANKFFTKCAINEDMELSDETSLYQLNLFALSRVLRGEIETAFRLEFRIKDFIEKNNIEVVGLKYVNFINIARLYKKTKDFTQSLEYYNKAYNEICGGGYATSDHIYYNMNLGSLHEAAGNKQQALQYWVKAALHWLACSNKYILSWRPRLILCSESIADISKPLPIDKANIFLLNKINELIQACNLIITHKEPQNCHFVEDTLNLKKEQCFINDNIVLFSSSEKINSSIDKQSESEQQLAHLISQYLQTIIEISPQQHVFIIDTHLDTVPLQSAEEAKAYANLSHCSSCYFNGQWLHIDNVDSLKFMTASLSKAIDSIVLTEKGLSVQYKRSFLNKTLVDQSEIDFVKQLKEHITMNLEHTSPALKAILHQLAQKRVLNFSYSD